MTDHDYKQSAYYLIYLIRCVLTGKQPAKQRLEKIDLNDLLYVAKEHSLSAICAYALNSAGIDDPAFEEEKNKAIRKNIILDAQRMQILARLEQEGIWYMPLKGVYLKDYYPMIGMRQMCDNDILFDKSFVDKTVEIMLSLGFYNDHNDVGHDIVFFKEPVSNFEMHTELFGGGTVYQMNEVFEEIIRDHRIKDDDSEYGYHFSNEDFYLYLIAHEYKHYILEGIGIRPLVDVYVFLKKFGDLLDREYIDSQLSRLGIADFERDNREIAMKLFSGEKLDEKQKKMLDYFIFCGAFGSFENRVRNRLRSSDNSKAKYVLSRLFIDDKFIKYNYPFFYKYKILIPFLPIYRVVKGFFKSRKRMFSEIRILKRLNK